MIRIKINGFDKIFNKLEKLQRELPSKYRIFLQSLSAIGFDTASIRFKEAIYDGTNDVSVLEPKWINENTIELEATGHAVAFIEFGTGVFYSEEHPLANNVGAIRGQFGKGRGKGNTWGYYGENAGTNGKVIRNRKGRAVVLTHGNPPAMAMYKAMDDVRNNIIKIAKEVF